jgi:DNA-binding SARP family transcriptional activator
LALSCEFGLLGPVLVLRDGAPVPMARGGQQAVLAALLLKAGRLVTTGELAEVLWGTEPPPTAGAALHNQVRRLRAALGPGDGQRICTEPGGYLIRVQPGELDLCRAEGLLAGARSAAGAGDWEQVSARAAAGLLLWRGQPMAGVQSDVLAREVSRLAEIQLSLSEMRLDAEIRLGRAAGAVSELRQLCAAHPLREHLHALLMLALHRCGRRAEALAAYQAARRVLIEELGSEPAAALRELHQQVLAGTGPAPPAALARADRGPGAARQRASAGQPAPDGTVGALPRQLPAPVRNFAGRQPELAALSALLDCDTTPAAPVISAIGGTAGVGKTALAVHWAHQVADRFPDGQLYVNLRGYDPGLPVPASDALASFLRALGVAGQDIPGDADERAAAYRSLLTGRRMLVVLDNARDAAHVRPLLPGSPGSLAVVTSRCQLTGLVTAEGAHALMLDLLTDVEARELLALRLGTARLDAEPAAVAELIGLCARLPLALAVAAARVSAQPRRRLGPFAQELKDAQLMLDRLETWDTATSVRAVFSWSLHSLSQPAVRTFGLLGLHPGPDITIPAAASLAGTPPSQAHQALRELADAHLATERVPGRFSLHDLLRAYAVEHAAASGGARERRAALHRLLDHYLHSADAANRELYPARQPLVLPAPLPGTQLADLAGAQQALGWLLAERRGLIAAARQAADLGFDRHAWQIPFCAAMFLGLHGYWDDWAAVQHGALTCARRLRDQAAMARLHIVSAHACMSAGCEQDALDHLQAALEVYRQSGDRVGQARAHVAFSLVLNRRGQHAGALGHAQYALVLNWSAGHRAETAQALNATGWSYALLGHPRRAMACCQRALELHREAGNRVGEAEALDSLGYIHQQLGEHGRAVASYQRALDLLRALASRHEEAVTRTRLGDAHLAAGHTRQARRAWRLALAVFAEENHPNAGSVHSRLAYLRHAANGDAGTRRDNQLAIVSASTLT